MERKAEWRDRAKQEIKDWVKAFRDAVAVECGGTGWYDWDGFFEGMYDCMRLRVIPRPTSDTICPSLYMEFDILMWWDAMRLIDTLDIRSGGRIVVYGQCQFTDLDNKFDIPGARLELVRH